MSIVKVWIIKNKYYFIITNFYLGFCKFENRSRSIDFHQKICYTLGRREMVINNINRVLSGERTKREEKMGDILLLILVIAVAFGVGYEIYYTYNLFPVELRNRGVQTQKQLEPKEKQEGSGIWNVLAFPILFILILLPFYAKDYNYWFRYDKFDKTTWYPDC